MSDDLTYRNYVDDTAAMRRYSEYQTKYARRIRESDRVVIDIIRGLDIRNTQPEHQVSLLDVGCSTGNLLFHLKEALPGLKLCGGDIVPTIIAECQSNPDLEGIEFSEMNILGLDAARTFDVVVANAALPFFNDDEIVVAFKSIAGAVRPGGWFVAFDWFHPFSQELTIVEKSKLHPEGLKFYFRSYDRVRASLHKAGLQNPDFRPFAMPIDLAKPQDASDITSYTVPTADGHRMSFRGTLFQPWCHVVTKKASVGAA